ncbi:MAG: hypothetical protein ACFBRM_13880 [Pikeienuella sp.]
MADDWAVAIGQGLVQYSARTEEGADLVVVCDLGSDQRFGNEIGLDGYGGWRDLGDAHLVFYDADNAGCEPADSLDLRGSGTSSAQPGMFEGLIARFAKHERAHIAFPDGVRAQIEIDGPRDGFASCRVGAR